MGTYTNTSNWKAIAGLVLTTLLASYVANNSTKIVEGSVSSAKKGLKRGWVRINDALHGGKQEYAVWSKDFDGKLYDTGRRVRR